MSLILSLGSNIGNRFKSLKEARSALSLELDPIANSNIYESTAVDYTAQPDFLNQVLEFEIPSFAPNVLLEKISSIETKLGRTRKIPKGPRILDIDILFWGTENFNNNLLIIPHPRLFERNFILFPLRELPFFETLKNFYDLPWVIDSESIPLIRNSE